MRAPGEGPLAGAGPSARYQERARLGGVAENSDRLKGQGHHGHLPSAQQACDLAYGTFAATMTLGRLLADRTSARFGLAAVLRYGAGLAAVGITPVALVPLIWAALAGWALFGLGLSGCVQRLFVAARHADPAAAGTHVSRVAGLGHVGMRAGPAVIGRLTHLVALDHAFLLPALCCAVAAAAAGVLRTSSDRPRTAELAA